MAETSRVHNTKRNIIWGFFQKTLSVLLPFFVRTALIYQLGVNYVGLNSFYLSILNMLNLAELGFGSAIAFCMYEPIAKKDHETVARFLRYFQKVYRVIGSIIFLSGLAIMPFLGNLISGSYPDDVNLQIGFFIYLVNTAVSYLLFGYRQTLLTAHQRNDVVSRIQSMVLIVTNMAQIIALLIFPNFYLFILIMPLTTLAQNILLYVASNRLFPQYKEYGFYKTGLTSYEAKFIRQRVIGIFLYRTCQVTRDSCDMIFISMFLGLTVAGCYSNYFMIASSVLIILEVICSSMTASVGNSIVSESKEKNFNDMRLLMFMYASIAAVCLACVLCLYQPFIEVWVGRDLMLPDYIVWLLCVYFYVRVLGDIRSVYVDATGLWWKLKGRSIIEAVLNIVLNLILVKLIGLSGVVVATIISMLLINYLWGSDVVFRYYFKNGGLKIFFKDNLVYVLATVVCCIVPYILLGIIAVPPLVKLFVGAFLAIVLSTGLWLLLFCRTKRFNEALAFIKTVRR